MYLDHLRYRRYIDAFIDGELDGDLRNRVGDHVALCPMCDRDAGLTIHVKYSLACHRSLPERAADRLRRWARRDLS